MNITNSDQKICLVAFYPVLGDPDKNIQKAVDIINRALKENVSLIVFPELSLSGYLLENLVQESAIGLEDQRLFDFKKLSQKADILLGTVLENPDGIYNSALVFSKGKIAHAHHKIYLPTYGMFDESRDFNSGDDLRYYPGTLGKTGILICEDAFHPILPYCLFVQRVKHVFILSSSPSRGFEDSKAESSASFKSWEERISHYAYHYGQYYYYINRSGVEDGIYFDGGSFAFSPFGKKIKMIKNDNMYFITINSKEIKEFFLKNPYSKEDNPELNQKILNRSIQLRYGN